MCAQPLTLYVYGGADGRFTLYNDAGDGYGYERGEYATVTYEWHDDEERLDAAFSGDARFALDEPVVEIIKSQLNGGAQVPPIFAC